MVTYLLVVPKRGPFGSSLKKSFFVPKGINTYKVYEQKNAIYNDFFIGDYYINQEKFNELKDFEVKPKDIIVSCSGTIGKIAIAPEKIERGIINQALLKISLDESIILIDYFRYLFQSDILQKRFLENTRGSAITNLSSVKELKEMLFPIPSLKTQKEIANKLKIIESIMKIIIQQQSLIDKKIEQLPKAVLQKAFRGEL